MVYFFNVNIYKVITVYNEGLIIKILFEWCEIEMKQAYSVMYNRQWKYNNHERYNKSNKKRNH